MPLIDQVTKDMVAAMKNREEDRLSRLGADRLSKVSSKEALFLQLEMWEDLEGLIGNWQRFVC